VGFSQFIKERKYLGNVSPATIEWYEQSLRWLGAESPTESQLKDFVMRMREKGLRATSCNNRIRAVNAYLHWQSRGSENGCGLGCDHLRVKKLKESSAILPVFSLPQVALLTRWKPRGFYQRRLHLVVLVLLDTGCRVGEVLCIREQDCDLDNLLLTVNGKGGKQRRVPFSFELRRVIVRYTGDFCVHPGSLVLGTERGGKLDRHVVSRSVKLLCRHLGFTPPARTLHAFRHTFAVNYLRRGGGVFHLQKVLGHSSLDMTRRYASLMTEDLQAVHQQISLLAA
jgi:integrase/recombinase XerD